MDWSSQFNGKGYVSQLSFDEICELWKHISRGRTKYGKNPRDPVMSRVSKSTSRTISREELGNFLVNFKTDILRNLSEQLDTLKIQNKQKFENVSLSIFYPMCRKKHALW